MKATGVVRRIDELGRVVIPKEVRKTLRIRSGDPLEIFTDRQGTVILKKYSPVVGLEEVAQEYAQSLNESIGNPCLIIDTDVVVAVAGTSAKKLLQKSIGPGAMKIMEQRKPQIIMAEGNELTVDQCPVVLDEGEKCMYVGEAIAPITTEQGDLLGAVIICFEEGPRTGNGELELKLAQTAARFLASQVE